MKNMLVTVAAGGAGLLVAGAIARNAVAYWHQRRMALMWRLVRLHVGTGIEIKQEGLESLLTGIWGKFRRGPFPALIYGQPRVAFEARTDASGTYFHWVVPADEVKFLQQLLSTCLPGVDHEELEEDYLLPRPPDGRALATTEIRMRRPYAYPLADFTRQFGTTLQGVLNGSRNQGEVTVQILLRPVRDGEWKRQAYHDLLRAEGKAPAHMPTGNAVFDAVNRSINSMFDAVEGQEQRPSSPPRLQTSRLERAETRDTPAKLMSPGFDVQIRIMAAASNRREAASLASRVAALFPALDGSNNLVARPHDWFPRPASVWPAWARRTGPIRAGNTILTPEELSSIVYPAPRQEVSNQSGVRIIELRRPPLAEGIHICDAMYRGQRVAVRVKPGDLDKHLGIQGKPGSGKGVLQEHLFRECAKLGMGGLYLDPLGGSVRKLLASMPEERMDDVIYIEVGNPDWAVPLNFLSSMDGDPEATVADAVNLYYKLWSDAWGKSTEEMLRAATIAVVEAGGALPEVELVLSDAHYRKSILPKVKNPAIIHFLQNLPDKVTENMRAPLNKLHELTWQDWCLSMVGQADSLDWVKIIRERRLVLVNANKGNPKIGQLGCMLVSGIIWSRICRAALSIPVPERQRFILIADELRDLGNRSADEFEMALAQLRQFLVPVVGTGQYPRQLPEKVWNAMSGCMGSKIVLREDQPHSKDCLAFLGGVGAIEESDLNNLPELVGFANLLIQDRPTGIFTYFSPPWSQAVRNPDEAALLSFRRWARPRAEVLAAIKERMTKATAKDQHPELN